MKWPKAPGFPAVFTGHIHLYRTRCTGAVPSLTNHRNRNTTPLMVFTPHGYFRVRYWSPQDHLSPNGVGSPDPPRFLCQNHIFFNGLECGSFGLKMTRNGLLAINFPPHFAGIFIPVSNAWPMWCPSLTINRHLPNQPFPQRFSFWQIVKRADRSPQDHLSPDGVGSPDPPRFLFVLLWRNCDLYRNRQCRDRVTRAR